MRDPSLVHYQPTVYPSFSDHHDVSVGNSGFNGGPGPFSYEPGGPLNLRPFWIEPRNLLPHNMYVASEIQLTDKSKLQANVLGVGAVGATVLAVGGETGLHLMLGALAGSWVLWTVDFPHGVRRMLTSPELVESILC